MKRHLYFYHRINLFVWGTLLLALIGVGCSGNRHRGHKESTSTRHPKDTATVYIQSYDFHPTVNVYLENSGSMDGYLTGVTEFEQIVYNFLTDLKIEQITDELNLFYINSRILPQRDDIDDFIKKLEPSTFKHKGGNRGTSDIAQMIDSIMTQMTDSTVSVFISDCIFSPGKGRSADDYLSNQEIGIKKSVGSYFNEHPSLAVIGYQCYSRFDGYYYDKNDAAARYVGRRPFYIWLMGTQGALRRITMKIPPERFHGEGVSHMFATFAGGKALPDSNYVVKRGSGNFELSHGDRHSLHSLKKNRGGRITFAIEANLAHVLLSEDYLADISNYAVDNEHYKIVDITRIPKDSRYTHRLKIEADHVTPAELNIFLLAMQPTWVATMNDEQGLALDASTAEKTFGIKYLVNGFAGAILREKPYYTRMTVNIR